MDEPLARYDTAQNRFVAVPIDLGPEGDQVFLSLFGTGWRFRSAESAVQALAAALHAGFSTAMAEALLLPAVVLLVGLGAALGFATPRHLVTPPEREPAAAVADRGGGRT